MSAHMMLANLDSVVKIIGGDLLTRSFNSRVNLHFVNEYNIRMSSINYEENGYEDILD